MAFISLKWRLLVAQGRGARLSGRELERLHNSRLVDLLLTTPGHLAALSPAQLVFTLFLAGIGREYPGLLYSSTPASSEQQQQQQQGHPIPDALYNKLSEVLIAVLPICRDAPDNLTFFIFGILP